MQASSTEIRETPGKGWSVDVEITENNIVIGKATLELNKYDKALERFEGVVKLIVKERK